MGTNYYADLGPNEYNGDRVLIHLGKNSAGRRFSIQANKFYMYKNWNEMKTWLRDKVIINEYDMEIDYNEFVELVEVKNKVIDSLESWADHHVYIGGYKFANYDFC